MASNRSGVSKKRGDLVSIGHGEVFKRVFPVCIDRGSRGGGGHRKRPARKVAVAGRPRNCRREGIHRVASWAGKRANIVGNNSRVEGCIGGVKISLRRVCFACKRCIGGYLADGIGSSTNIAEPGTFKDGKKLKESMHIIQTRRYNWSCASLDRCKKD